MMITLTTDFGVDDPYVGMMKGVILSIAPAATLVDLTHNIPPQDILAGALAVEAATPCFPTDTIHLAVIDPGVGGQRAPVAIRTELGFFVGPDNGLFTHALSHAGNTEAVRLSNPKYHRHPVSDTFHGRDIFAPTTGHLAAGVRLQDLGEPQTDLTKLPVTEPAQSAESINLHIIHADRFGNLITDLRADQYQRWLNASPTTAIGISAGTAHIPKISRTYKDVEKGKPVAYFGSSGRLEIATRGGSAATALDLKKGDTVRVHRLSNTVSA